MKRIAILTIATILPLFAFSQRLSFGVHTQVNLNLTDSYASPDIQSETLPRYGLGFVMVQDLNKKIKTFKYGSLQGRANLRLEYGLNYVVRAYGYKFQNEYTTHDYKTMELPIMLHLVAENNTFTRGWDKKNINLVLRLGMKGTYSQQQTYRTMLGSMDDGKYLVENGFKGGYNLLFAESVGITRELSNGDTSGLFFTLNLGAFTIASSTIDLYTDQNILSETLFYKGGYLSLDWFYLFGRSDKLEAVKPVIFCPGF